MRPGSIADANDDTSDNNDDTSGDINEDNSDTGDETSMRMMKINHHNDSHHY